ncbi:MAG: carboxypeptidase-like regulatory domain-containing protein [Terracidiphilus sp.]|jgi:tetratricopeptide (TPR) repeat protein
MSAQAQQPPAPETGGIHGRVINPAGVPQKNGTVSLSVDGGETLSYTFPVSPSGEYSGQAPPGEYTIVYRAPDTPDGKIVDYISGVQVAAGQDTAQDIDMTRREFIERLSPDQQRQLQELREANAAASSDAKRDASAIDADLEIVNLDLQAAGNARVTATQNLGGSAARQDVDSMTAEIENAKLTEIEILMTKDAATAPTEPVVWIGLGRAEAGLRNYLDAESDFKKALDLAQKEEPPRPEVAAEAQAGLGEVYARTLMVDDANAAFDAAAKADPSNAAKYLRSQAIVFFNAKNFDAQVDAADLAIKADPDQAILYYIKADGLAQNARVDPDTNKLVLPPGCADALRKYLDLDPNGPYAANATTILQRVGEPSTTPIPTPQK